MKNLNILFIICILAGVSFAESIDVTLLEDNFDNANANIVLEPDSSVWLKGMFKSDQSDPDSYFRFDVTWPGVLRLATLPEVGHTSERGARVRTVQKYSLAGREKLRFETRIRKMEGPDFDPNDPNDPAYIDGATCFLRITTAEVLEGHPTYWPNCLTWTWSLSYLDRYIADDKITNPIYLDFFPLENNMDHTFAIEIDSTKEYWYVDNTLLATVSHAYTPAELDAGFYMFLDTMGWIDTLRVGSFEYAKITATMESPTDCDGVQEAGLTLLGDINHDCYVDIFDLAIMTEESWLVCNDPENEDCIENW